MKRTIEETERRRGIQEAYNLEHNQVPTALTESKDALMKSTSIADGDAETRKAKATYELEEQMAIAAEPKDRIQGLAPVPVGKMIKATERAMKAAAKALDFIEAAKVKR